MNMMKDISKAGYGLLGFVEAVLQYCIVFKEVKPKKDKLDALEKEFEIVRIDIFENGLVFCFFN